MVKLKSFKGLSMIVAIAFALLVGSFGFNPGSADAAFGCKNTRMQSAQNFYEYLVMCVDDGQPGEVRVSLDVPTPAVITAQYDWQMQLQRWEGGKWVVLGERFGYTSNYSPSSRTFTNIGTKGTLCRIALSTADYYGGKIIYYEFYK